MNKDCSHKSIDIDRLLSMNHPDMDRYVTRGEFLQFEKRIDNKLEAQTESINQLRSEFHDLKGEFKDLRGEFKDLKGEFKDFKTEMRTEFKDFTEKIDKKMWIMIVAIVIGVIMNNMNFLINFFSNLP